MFPSAERGSKHTKYLFGQPADVLEMGVRGGRGPQVGVDVGQRVRQQGGDVGVDGGEPGVGGGAVLAAQHHRVLAVRGVQLQEPERDAGDREENNLKKCLSKVTIF